MKIFLCVFLLFLNGLVNAKDHDNVFNEELVIKELSNNFVNTYFQFTTRWNINSRDDRKFYCEKKNQMLDCFLLLSLAHRFAIALHIRIVSSLRHK